MSLLLSHQNNVTAKGSAYETALERAAENGHTDIVIDLLDHSIEEPAKKQEMVHRIFCLASYNNHPEVLLWALENGANINGQVKQALHEIPLSWAASRGHNDIVRLLLAKGANQHARRPHQPLSSAVRNGFATTVMLLIDTHIAGCGGGSYRDFFNEEKLSKDFVHHGFIVAAQHGHAHTVRLFVDLGFDLERYPKVGHSALMMAAQEGHQSIARMLVEMGVNVNAEDGKESPVVMAEQYGRADMVALLVQLGAKNMVETRDNGVKILNGEALHDNSRIRVWSAGKYIVDYKSW